MFNRSCILPENVGVVLKFLESVRWTAGFGLIWCSSRLCSAGCRSAAEEAPSVRHWCGSGQKGGLENSCRCGNKAELSFSSTRLLLSASLRSVWFVSARNPSRGLMSVRELQGITETPSRRDLEFYYRVYSPKPGVSNSS